jgi:shikimate dehydrogenase
MTVPSIRRACVMGHPVAQSRSPLLHGYWLEKLGLDGAYVKVDVPPRDFPDFLHKLRANYVGGNITTPHKEAAFRLVDRHDAAAAAIGAVNTVWFEDDTLVGGNTDAFGYLAHLDVQVPGWAASGGLALVLGAGGAARAVVHALVGRGLDIAIVNRTRARADELAAHFGRRVSAHACTSLPALMKRACLLTNTTSLGAAGQPPLDIDIASLNRNAIVYDINYVPLETDLMKNAGRRGHRIVDGLGMLLHQAVPGFSKWFGVRPQVTPELRALLETDIRAQIRSS